MQRRYLYVSMDIDRIRRGINHYHTKLAALFYERKYAGHGTRVKYLFFPKKGSDALIVSFPGCSPHTAKYNYMRTLLPFRCNKLFLLDDFGDNHQGCYLVEEHVEQCTKELIEQMIQQCAVRNLILVGSSKGGYSALNFSLLIPGATVVIGAPQYFLATYLDTEDTQTNLRFLIGNDMTDKAKQQLDNRLRERILTSSIRPQCVYLHYSKAEHTYEEHVKALLADLHTVGISVVEDVHAYLHHGDLKDYYPPFLVTVCFKLFGKWLAMNPSY